MQSYIRTVLHPDEHVIYVAHVHWIVYMEGLGFVIFAALFAGVMPYAINANFGSEAVLILDWPISLASLGFLVVGLLLLLGSYVRRHHNELAITDRRIIGKRGHISRTSFEVGLDRVAGATYDQTTLGRMLNYGTIHLMFAGATIAPIQDIGEPHYFIDVLTTTIERKKLAEIKGKAA